MTLYTANTALIAQPGRAVNTFPSGLVRVDQVYLGLTSQAATHRATLAVGNDMPDGNSSPCIDGLKIFPEVQERRREDGFTEFIVSAYGRANSVGKTDTNLVESKIICLNLGDNSVGGLRQNKLSPEEEQCFTLQTKFSYVAPISSTISQTFSPDLKAYKLKESTSQILDISIKSNLLSILSPSIVVEINGNQSSGYPANDATISVAKSLSTLSKIKYGAFEEITAVFDTQISVLFKYTP